VLPGVAPSDVVTVVAAGDRVTVVTRADARSFDAARPNDVHVVDLRAAVPGGIAGAAATRSQLWLVSRAHADLVRVDPTSGRVVATLRYLDDDRAYRPPTQVLTHGREVWLLAPRSPDPSNHAAEVLRVDPADGHVRTRILAPSRLFVGALARTG
jgi:hypothetical protein